MHTHDLLVDECDQRHVVETLIKLLPKSDFVPSLDLVEEAVDSSDCLGFVITSEDHNLLGISYFQSEEKTDALATLPSSVDVVTHKQISLIFV